MLDISGVFVRRGDLEMLLIGDTSARPSANPVAFIPAPHRDLGRWRLTGEICDGKCYGGAMKPGAGLAHKACANLFLIGGVPPVFVATDRVDGAAFFLLGNSAGGPVGPAVLDHTAVLVEAEGRVERRGDLHVFLIDPASVRLAR